MIVNASNHLCEVDAKFINLGTRTDRRDRIVSTFSDVFKSLERVEPVSFEDRKQAGIEYKHKLVDTRNNHDPKHIFDRYYVYQPVDYAEFRIRGKFVPKGRTGELNGHSPRVATWCPEQYAGHYSLLLTTIGILKDFLASGKEHMAVLEDDAMPRDGFLDSEVDIPDNANILVWGGAIPSHTKDNRAYLDYKPFKFHKLRCCKSIWFTTCYEFDRVGAKALLDAFEGLPACTIDTGWGYAFGMCNAYSLRPQGIVQDNNMHNGTGTSNISIGGTKMVVSRPPMDFTK